MISRLFRYNNRPHQCEPETHVWRDARSGRWFQLTMCMHCGIGSVARVVEVTIEQMGRQL